MEFTARRPPSWADKDTNLLSQIFARVNFPDKFTCQRICRAWHHVLSVSPTPGVWGHNLTICQKAKIDLIFVSEKRNIVPLPDVENFSSVRRWIQKRSSSWEKIACGTFEAGIETDKEATEYMMLLWLLGDVHCARLPVKIAVHLAGTFTDHASGCQFDRVCPLLQKANEQKTAITLTLCQMHVL